MLVALAKNRCSGQFIGCPGLLGMQGNSLETTLKDHICILSIELELACSPNFQIHFAINWHGFTQAKVNLNTMEPPFREGNIIWRRRSVSLIIQGATLEYPANYLHIPNHFKERGI